jgi:Mrp family chromosome partitioning ATPase
MTALDQAFIKAFSQQGRPVAAIPPKSAAPTAKQSPLPPATGRGEENFPRDQGPTGNVSFAREAASLPLSDTFGSVLAVLEKPPVRSPDWSKAEGESGKGQRGKVQEPPSIVVGGEPWDVGAGQWATDSAEWAVGSEPWAMDSLQCMTDGPPTAVADREAAIDQRQPAADNSDPAAISHRLSTINHQQTFSEFKPAWQVERFTWPRVCRRLIGRAADELDRLADALMMANARGQQVVAVGGYRQGEGATTLLLCAARRLAERGIKAVLVDADRNRPRLAKRLGVQPQLSWNEVAVDENGTLNQVVVEASSNNLALAPLDESSVRQASAARDWSRLASCIETLREHYEMVLVDPGPLEDLDSIGDVLAATAGGKIDAVLLVRNRRITSEEDLTEIEQRLNAAEIAVTGLIENFVVEE